MKEKLANGALLLGAAKGLTVLLGLLSTFLLARLLTPEDFGLFAVATLLLSVIGPVTELSLSSALIQQRALSEDHFHTSWTLGMFRGALVALVFVGAAPFVADYYSDQRLIEIMLAIGASILISGAANPKLALFARNLNFWPSFAISVGQKLAGVLVGVIAAFIYRSYWALLLGTLATQIAMVVISYSVVRYRPRFSLGKARELLSFSIWLTLGKIINTINWKLDHFFVALFQGPKILGLYVMGDNLASMPTREVVGPIEQTLFPGLAAVADDKERLRRTYQRAQGLITAIVLPIGLVFALHAQPLVLLVLGAQWQGAVIIVQVLAAIFAVQTLGSMAQALSMAKGQTKLMFYRDLVGFGIRVPIISYGAFTGGLIGIVYARAVTGIIGIFINLFVVRQLLQLSIWAQIKNSWRSLLSGVFMAAISIYWAGRPEFFGVILSLFISCAVALASYALCHLAFWFLTGRPQGAESDMWDLLRKKIPGFKRAPNQ